MQLSDWEAIQENDFVLPPNSNLETLTSALVAQIGTPHSELREITYDILSEWILGGNYTRTQLTRLIDTLTQNLQFGIGEVIGDSVFLRSFSALLLGEIVNYDNDAKVLDAKDVRTILASLLSYFDLEQDTRGWVDSKGWAHALEHTQLALSDVARSPHLAPDDVQQIITTLKRRGLSLKREE